MAYLQVTFVLLFLNGALASCSEWVFWIAFPRNSARLSSPWLRWAWLQRYWRLSTTGVVRPWLHTEEDSLLSSGGSPHFRILVNKTCDLIHNKCTQNTWQQHVLVVCFFVFVLDFDNVLAMQLAGNIIIYGTGFISLLNKVVLPNVHNEFALKLFKSSFEINSFSVSTELPSVLGKTNYVSCECLFFL